MNSVKLFSIFLINIFFTLSLSGCSLEGEIYGIKEIENNSGEKLYFHRAARGLNYDVTFLSAKSMPSLDYDESTDLRVYGMGDKFFYKFDKGHLQIYVPGKTPVPQGFSADIEITQNVINNLEFFDLEKNYQTKGLQSVEVELDEELDCGSSVFTK